MVRGAMLGLLILAGAVGAADDDPRALIQRAVKEMGGEEKLRSYDGAITRVKGKVTFSGDQMAKTTAEMTSDLYTTTDGKQRHNTTTNFMGQEVGIIYVYNGAEAWSVTDGQVQKLNDGDSKWLKASSHQERVTSLWPLLHDKGFTFKKLPEQKVLNRPALGVLVSFKDKPDIKLFFDKETGLLCQYQFKAPGLGGQGGEEETETTLSSYKPLDFARMAEEKLTQAKKGTSNKELLELIKTRTIKAELLEKVPKWIRALSDESFEVREKAGQELVALGAAAVPALKAAAMDKDAEVAQRAGACLKAIGEQENPEVLVSAICLVGRRETPGAAEALLALLPSADPAAAGEIRVALYGLALKKGEAEQFLQKALQDKNPLKRAAAQAVLGKDGGAWIKRAGRPVFPTGLQAARKMAIKWGTNQEAELELVDTQFYNRLDDKLFARPE